MGSTTRRRASGIAPVAPARAPRARAFRSLGDHRAPSAPAAVDLAEIVFALVVPGGGGEFAPSPLRRTGAQSGSHLQEVPPVGAWAAQGVCRNQTDLFFPERGRRPQAALDLCGRCPVREPCLAYGLSHPAQLGVLGGMTVEERRRLRAASKAATKAARGTDELPLCAVLEDLARYPVSTWGQIARSDDHEALVRLAFELGAGWRRLPPGRWEFDVQRADSPEGADHATILRARLAERDLSVLSSPEGSSREASCPEASPVMAPPAHEAPHPRSAVG